jgi:hypothetical protein
MHRCTKNPSFSRIGALAIAGLAFCVFIWGLESKLSLYDPPDAASHHIPTAKLLSKNEQSSSTENQLLVQAKTSARFISSVPTFVFFILLLVVSRPNPRLSGQSEQRASRLWLRRRALLRVCFVRPPPVLA